MFLLKTLIGRYRFYGLFINSSSFNMGKEEVTQRLQLSRFGREISRFEANFPKSPRLLLEFEFLPLKLCLIKIIYKLIIKINKYICWIKCSQKKAQVAPESI